MGFRYVIAAMAAVTFGACGKRSPAPPSPEVQVREGETGVVQPRQNFLVRGRIDGIAAFSSSEIREGSFFVVHVIRRESDGKVAVAGSGAGAASAGTSPGSLEVAISVAAPQAEGNYELWLRRGAEAKVKFATLVVKSR